MGATFILLDNVLPKLYSVSDLGFKVYKRNIILMYHSSHWNILIKRKYVFLYLNNEINWLFQAKARSC